jgi:CHASE2 domain-containing sensor protein
MAPLSIVLALAYRPQTDLPSWWLVLSVALVMALLPTLGVMVRSPKTQRILLLLVGATIAGCGVASASMYDWPSWCNPDWIPYMICWPW